MVDKVVLTIDGEAFDDLDGFYDAITELLSPGVFWGRNLNALDGVELVLEYDA